MLNQINNNINILNKALDGLWLRDKVINQNISNANTPKYKRKMVSFEKQLREAMINRKSKLSITHNKHLPTIKNLDQVEPRIDIDKSYSYRFDGNNVNIDMESADLAKNAIMYNAIVNQTVNEFDKIKNLINEGSK